MRYFIVYYTVAGFMGRCSNIECESEKYPNEIDMMLLIREREKFPGYITGIQELTKEDYEEFYRE